MAKDKRYCVFMTPSGGRGAAVVTACFRTRAEAKREAAKNKRAERVVREYAKKTPELFGRKLFLRKPARFKVRYVAKQDAKRYQ